MSITTIGAATPGATYVGLAGRRGASFLGIRYAEPPVGQLRWRPPVAIAPAGVIEATRPGDSPPQIQRRMPVWAPLQTGFRTGEDCLNLNIFTSGVDDHRRPVVVHVFGGGFQTGSASGTYQDDLGFAARGDVVLVRTNFRVGALGFLHLGPAMGSGFRNANLGMLDLVAALRWVRRNIAAFGGDPDNVTLLGMSSGAFTVASLFGTDGVESLFRRAWLMSGSASRIVDADTASSMARDFLALAGVEPGDVAALEALPVETVLGVQERIVATDLGVRNSPGGRTLGIVADGSSLLRHPLLGLETRRWAEHDLVVGWTRNEARLWYALGAMPPPPSRHSVVATIARFHPADADAILRRMENEEPHWNLAELEEAFLSRTVYRDAALRTARTHVAGGGSAHIYEFAWVPEYQGGRLGASHGFDEPFVFGIAEPDRVPLLTGSPTASLLAEEMSSSLYGFARGDGPGWAAWDSAGPPKRFV